MLSVARALPSRKGSVGERSQSSDLFVRSWQWRDGSITTKGSGGRSREPSGPAATERYKCMAVQLFGVAPDGSWPYIAARFASWVRIVRVASSERMSSWQRQHGPSMLLQQAKNGRPGAQKAKRDPPDRKARAPRRFRSAVLRCTSPPGACRGAGPKGAIRFNRNVRAHSSNTWIETSSAAW